jgi:uncharacterized protein with FMN-binding domain
MRRITLWLFSTVAAVVLLFSYRTSTEGAAATSTAAAPLAGSGGSSIGDGSSSAGGKSYAGSVAQTRWGPLQVSITVSGGRITDVAVPTYPSGNGRDVEINARALPTLRQETLDKQSADIDAVSGATVTSDGYKESLQSALDAANLK